MFLSDLAIRRPVLASMASAALVLFGVIGYQRLAVREFPDVDPPIIPVSVTPRGANPRVMESAVTDVLEEQLSSLEGLRQMTSSSGEQRSNVTLEFNLERPIEAARRMIETGLRTPGFVEVRGIEPGEQVVVSGGERLMEGAAVLPTLVVRLPMSGREVTP